MPTQAPVPGSPPPSGHLHAVGISRCPCHRYLPLQAGSGAQTAMGMVTWPQAAGCPSRGGPAGERGRERCLREGGQALSPQGS